MRKWLLLATVSAYSLILASPALADPISGAIVATLGWNAFWTATAQIALNIAFAVGLYYASKEFASDPSRGEPGFSLTMQTGGVVARSIPVGRFATGGSLVYWGTWGTDGDTPNAFITHVIALGDVPITSLTEVWEGATKGVYDTGQVLQTQGYPIAAFNPGPPGSDNLWVKFYDGTQTTADPFLQTIFGSDPDYPYGSNRIGTGVPYVIVTARRNSQFFVGRPEYRFAGVGAKFYDQRLDTTAGGSGAHRFNDQTTWAATLNPIVIANNIMRGISYGGAHLYGLQGLPVLRLPVASWFAAMNECDALIDDMGGDPVAQYRCGVEIPVNVPPASAIETLLMACNGRIAEIGGIYKVLAGAPGSSVLAFTDEGINVSQPQSFDPFPAIDQAINGLTATYMAPEAAWEQKDLPLRKNDDAVAEDGENYLAVNYAAVFDPGQAQRLQTSALNEALNHRKHAHTLTPGALILEPLDVVAWTSTRNGYIGKLFLLNSVTIAPNLDIPIAIGELDPTDYDFDPDTDHLPISVPFLTAPILPDPTNAPTGLTASQAGNVVTLRWDMMVNYGFSGYDVLSAPQGQPIGSATYRAENHHTNVIGISDLPAGPYTFFVVGRDSLDIPGQAARGAAASINFTILALQEQTNQQLIAAQEALEALAAAQVRQTLAQWAAMQNNYAATTRATNELTQTVIDGQSIIARHTMEVAAELRGVDIILAASVTSVQTAYIAADAVLADSIDTISTTVGDHTAELIIHASSLNGLHLNWTVSLNVDNRVVGMVRLDGGAFNSKFVVVSDAFEIFTPGGSQEPIFEIDGVSARFRVPLIADLVGTENIQANAVNVLNYEVVAGPTSAAAAEAYTALNDVTVTSTGAPTSIRVNIQIRNADTGNHTFGVVLRRDGADLIEELLQSVLASSRIKYALEFIDDTGSGSFDYTVKFKSDSTAVAAVNSTAVLTELKK